MPRTVYLPDRPLLILQSDDWGRIGLCDSDGARRLANSGIKIGEQPYDFYTLETSADLEALISMLSSHRDSTGRPAVMVMNFITANLDFRRSLQDASKLHFQPLADGLPDGWSRPGLLEGYRQGVAAGLFYPALHGASHFCRQAVQRYSEDDGERGHLLRTLWAAGTPYIYWRMPWIGYEYWDFEQPSDQRFLRKDQQEKYIGEAVALFAKLFGTLPRSACAPGYRANSDTNSVWSALGIRSAQNGPSSLPLPHFDKNGTLQLYRTIEFEPAVSPDFSLENVLRKAEDCFAARIPAVLSVHSINFHSTVRDFRSRTLSLLDSFLGALESRHPDLLYVHDDDLFRIIESGSYESSFARPTINVKKKRVRSLDDLRRGRA